MDITSLILSDEGVVFITSENTEVISDKAVLKKYFDNLAKKGIKRMTRTSDKEYSSLTFNDNTRVKFQNFNAIRKKIFCKELNKQISIFKLKQIAKKLGGKNIIVVGSVVGVITTSINLIDEFNKPAMAAETYTENDIQNNIEDYLNPVELNIEDIDDLEENKKAYIPTEGLFVEPPKKNKELLDNEDIDPLSNDINNLGDNKEKKEIKIEEKPLTTNSKPLAINPNIFEDGLDYTKIETLKEINNYDQFILFASNLYGVDYNKAVEVVKQNWNTFTTPGNKVNEYAAAELDRMKDLVSKGLINGDMNVIGIFLTIKNYAYDYTNLNNEPAIISDKKPADREKESVYIAKYVYGVENQELLNTMVATSRIESGSGISDAGIYKNNIGGNMSSSATPDHLVLNTYKTAEIGEESFVRNFLNCYGKACVKYNYDLSIPIPQLVSVIYCEQTANEWADAVSGIIQDQNIENTINNYLGNSKTL